MSTNYSPTQAMPKAFVSVRRQRQKIYPNQQIFLDNGKEYEFELFNPTTDTILVKISIGGHEIPAARLVLEPSRRVFLDRYLDSSRKFKFFTYMVDGDNDQVKHAIMNNGKVSVSFYKVANTTTCPYSYPYERWGLFGIRVYSSDSFECTAFHSVNYHILPLSKKPVKVDEIRCYCPQCGRKFRDKENFCPKCGTKRRVV